MSTFSSAWYSIFLDGIAPAQTEAEVAFIARHLPLSSHTSILDLCCGPGRHANALARRGYRVLGVDSNAVQVARASADAPAGASFRTLDMRNLTALDDRFDAVINLWASFGYFDDDTNQEVVRQIAERLRPGGRAIVDLYNREHMVTLPASDVADRGGVRVETTRSWLGNRLKLQLAYDSRPVDDFEWRVYTPSEFSIACAAVGLETVLSCAWFTESLAASAEHARMQFVLERR